MSFSLSPPPLDDTDAFAAAAIAGITCYLEVECPQQEPMRRAWGTAAALQNQRLPPARSGAFAAWGQADRSLRAERWSYGIVGT